MMSVDYNLDIPSYLKHGIPIVPLALVEHREEKTVRAMGRKMIYIWSMVGCHNHSTRAKP